VKFQALMALALAFASASPTLSAQAARRACPAQDASLPPQFAGWTARAASTSAAKAGDLREASLAVGKAVTATLHPTGEMAYVAEPEKADGPPGYGGMFNLTIDQPGTYTVALGSGPWVDVVETGKSLDSTAHGHGPDCSTIHKVVAFSLRPGRYVVQVVANADPTLAIMIARNR
jgi:hypothetical protein